MTTARVATCFFLLAASLEFRGTCFGQQPSPGVAAEKNPTQTPRSSGVEPAGFEWPSIDSRSERPAIGASAPTNDHLQPRAISKPNGNRGESSSEQVPRAQTPTFWSAMVPTIFIVGLILVASWLLRKNGHAAPGGIPHDALEILGKRPLDQRQQIFLVRCGNRVLVVGSSTNGLNTLAEVTDPVEIDYLAGLCRSATTTQSLTKGFSQLLARQTGWLNTPSDTSHSTEHHNGNAAEFSAESVTKDTHEQSFHQAHVS